MAVGTSDFSQADGTFTGGNSNITFSDAFTLTGGVFNSTSATFQISGNFTHNVATGTFNEGTGIVKFSGSASNFDVDTSEILKNVEVSKSNVNALTISSTDTMIVSGTLTLTDGYVNTGTIDARTSISQAVNFDGGSATLDFGDNGVVQAYTIAGGSVGPNLRFDNASDASDSVELNGNATLWGLTITFDFGDANTVLFTYNGNNLTIGGNSNANCFNQASGIFTAPGTLTISYGNGTSTGFVKSGGTFIEGTGTVIFSAQLTTNIIFDVAATETLYNVELTSGGDSTGTLITTSETMVVAGALTLTNGVAGSSTFLGTIDARAGISQAATFDGGFATLDFGNNGAIQTYTIAGGTGPFLRFDNPADASDSVNLGGNASLSGLIITVDFGDANTVLFNYYGFTLTLGGNSSFANVYNQASGIFTAPGTLTVKWGNGTSAGFVKSGGTFTEGTGTVIFSAGTTKSVIFDVATNETLYNVEFTSAGNSFGTVVPADDTMEVAGALTLTNGIAGTGTINTKGSAAIATTFDGGTAAMKMTGTVDQTLTLSSGVTPTGTLTVTKSSGIAYLTGSGNLHNISLTQGTLIFQANNTFTIDDADTITTSAGTTLNFAGTVGNLVTLKSDTASCETGGAGAQWSLNVNASGFYSSDYVDVKCSDASAGRQITTFHSINSLNNTNWVFAPGSPLDVSGTCQKYNQSTSCADGETVRAAVNGSLNGDAVLTSSGAFSVTNMSYTSGDIITIFVDGVADDLEANAVTKYDGSGGLTGVLLYEEHLTIGSDDNQTLTNVNLSSYDNSISGDEDVFFDVDGSNVLSVDSLAQSAQEKLYVKINNVLQSGANVNTHNVQIIGTFDAGSSIISLSGSWVNSSGTFTAGASTVDFTASLGTETLNSGGIGAGKLFNNLTHSGAGILQLSTNALDVDGDFNNSAGTFDANGLAISVAGSWANSGIFTSNSNTVTFDSTSGARTLSGNMTTATSSAFYKVVFNGSGGTWTIQDAMKVSAANAADTFVIGNGTVTLGNSANDNLEVDGKMTIAAASGQTGTFQTYALSQADGTITIDINNNATRPACSNCIIQVGQSDGESGQGNLKIKKNTILRLNPNDDNSYTSVQVERTGYLEVLGSQDVNNAASTGLDTVALRETKLCANADFSAGHANKRVRLNSGLAIGKIYSITASTVNDTDCASDADDSITRADNTSDTDPSPTVSGSGPSQILTLSVETIVTANNDHIGRYVHNLVDDKYYKIVDSTETGSDTLIIIGEPDSFATMDTNDDIEVTDGVKPGDTFDVLDYAHVTAENGTACDAPISPIDHESYINAKQYSETLIQYADICNLGNGVPTYEGINFASVDGSNPNEGVTISKSIIWNNSNGITLNGSSNNNTSKGITNNSIYSNAIHGIYIDNSSNNNTLSNNNVYDNSSAGIYVNYQSSNNTVSSNITYNNSLYGFVVSTESYHNSLSSNVSYDNTVGFYILIRSHNTIFSDNISFGNLSHGVFVVDSSNNFIFNNSTYYNGSNIELSASSIGSHNNTVTQNTVYGGDDGITLFGGSYNTISFNNIYNCSYWGLYISPGTSSDSRNTVLMGNNSYNNNTSGLGFSQPLNTTTGTIGINENYGGLGVNGADIWFNNSDPTSKNLRLYNSTLASSTEATGVVASGDYVISRKNDSVPGLTKVWGEYAILDQIDETPQDETTDKYNYTESLWEDSFTIHGYNAGMGAGTEDADLDYGWGGAFGGDSSVYHYRLFCPSTTCGVGDGAVWEVYRNDTLLANKAVKGTIYTDTQNDGGSAPNVQFRIDGGSPTEYTYGATYNFTAWKAGDDPNITKNVKMMQDGDTYTAGTGKTWEMVGDAAHRTTSTHNSGTDGYNYIVDGGTIDFEFADYDYLKGNKGIDIRANSNVVSLTDTKYDNYVGSAATDDAFITVAASVIDSNELTFLNNQFDNPGLAAEFNVHRLGDDDTGYWWFHLSTGDYDGEPLDGGNGADEDDPGMIRWDPWEPSPSPSPSPTPSAEPPIGEHPGGDYPSRLPETGALVLRRFLWFLFISLALCILLEYLPLSFLAAERKKKNNARSFDIEH